LSTVPNVLETLDSETKIRLCDLGGNLMFHLDLRRTCASIREILGSHNCSLSDDGVSMSSHSILAWIEGRKC